MPDANGSPTLDRIERALELLPNYRVQFHDEHKLLLTAQAALTDRLNKLTERVNKPLDLGSRSDDRLNALITVVDGLVRRQQ
jgi:hypothetical protein